VAEMKASKSNVGSEIESELERGRQIIDVEPGATISTTKLHPGEPDEPEEGQAPLSFTDVGKRHPTTLHR
jgi:hypothetical protein